jgi:hypothetical protein
MTRSRTNDGERLASLGIELRDGFMLRKTRFGDQLVLGPAPAEAALRFMLRTGLDRLEINRALGFARDELGFLGDFAFLRGLEIIDRDIRDIAPIQRLPALQTLSIQTSCDTPIDFAQFADLRRCRLIWRAGRESILDCKQLQGLHLESYSGDDAAGLAGMTALNELMVTNSPVRDISTLAELTQLTELGLINLRRLADLDPLAALAALERLEIDGAKKIRDLEVLRGLTRLRVLYFCNVGEIPSIRVLAHLRDLEELYFWEDTRVRDGDLSVLLELPRLRKVAFRARRHYSHTPDAIEETIARES